MRGKDGRIQRFCFGIGITPAYAGKSGQSTYKNYECGEKLKAAISTMMKQGSPPPMRGKAHGVDNDVRLAGITPAYAGKSRFSRIP